MYEVVDGDRSFTALIRGGSECGGRGLLDGVILAGWRTGARVQVVFQRYLAIAGRPSCVGAPGGKKCFVGTIHVGRAPRTECAARTPRGHPVAGLLTSNPHVNTGVDDPLMQRDAKEIALRVCPGEEVG